MHLLILILLSLTTLLLNSWLFTLYINNLWQCTRDGPRRGPTDPPWVLFFFFFVILYFIFVFRPFSPISLVSLTQIATLQPKNLTKTIKIFTMMIVFQQKNYFTTKEQKNNVLFATTVNWYKYQLLGYFFFTPNFI